MEFVNTFEGGIEGNLDRHLVPPNKYVNALHIRNGRKDQVGVITPAKGNQAIEFTLPSGTNEVIGVLEDKNGAIYYFLKNSLGSHRILKYDGTITVISKNGFLDFDNDIRAVKIDDLLYWTDAKTDLTGYPPRKINVEKSRRNKIFEYELILQDTSYQVGDVFTVRVLDDNLNEVFPTTVFYTVPAGPPSRDAIAFAITANLLAIAGVTAVSTYIPQTDTHRFIISYPANGHRVIITAPGFWLHGHNNYDFVETTQLTVIKPCPKNSPRPEYVVDASIITNTLWGFAFQFRYRYIFDDGEKSAWSPASYAPTNFAQATLPELTDNSCVVNTMSYTKIDVKFEDDILDWTGWRTMIKAIEVCVRNDKDGIWRLIDRFPLYTLGVNDPKITFKNDRLYQAVPSDEDADINVQALKNFDFVPRLSLSPEIVTDESGNAILAWGGNLEYYDYEVIGTVEVSAYSDGPASPLVNQTSVLKTLKGGGRYKVGVVLEDEYGRQTSVIPIDTVSIPFQDNLQYGLTVDLNGVPPEWCTRWRVCVSRNMNQSIYFQLPAFKVKKWLGNPDKEVEMVEDEADGNYVGFQFEPKSIPSSLRNIFFENRFKEREAFIPEDRDRLQVILWNRGSEIPDTEGMNYAVAGYCLTYPDLATDIEKFIVFVKNDGTIPEWTGSAVSPTEYVTCEVYRPSNAEAKDLYYELSDAIDVIDNVEPAKREFGSPVDVEFGDTYVVARELEYSFNSEFAGPVSVGVRLQRSTLHHEAYEECNDLGRVVVFDPDYKELFSYEQIRASDVYIPNSLANGFSSYRGLNYIRINRAFGPIRSLKLLDTVLLAIAEFKCQPIYVSKDRLMDLSGNSTVGRTSRLLNIADELQTDLGTKDPKSVVMENGIIYAWDSFKRVAWYYTSGGGQNSLGNENNFINLTGEALAGFERDYNTYHLKIGDVCWAFNGMWYTQNTFPVENFATLGLDFFYFKDGVMYLHDVGNTMFGAAYEKSITFVVNPEPGVPKLFDNITQVGSGLWRAEISIPATPSYPSGMTSQLIGNKWLRYEGQYKADFLRDQTDPQFSSIADLTIRTVTSLLKGRPLRGERADITLKLIDSGVLRMVKTNVR